MSYFDHSFEDPIVKNKMNIHLPANPFNLLTDIPAIQYMKEVSQFIYQQAVLQSIILRKYEFNQKSTIFVLIDSWKEQEMRIISKRIILIGLSPAEL